MRRAVSSRSDRSSETSHEQVRTICSELTLEGIARLLLAEKGRLLAFLEERIGSRADAEDMPQVALLRVVTRGRPYGAAIGSFPGFK